ncbi:MAG: PorT family protein [Bacteroidales bacterium]|jgi:hypothetical protein|nr:PorT family protein [Bacteroidales bacterium]
MFKKVVTVAVAAVLTAGYAQAQFKFGARAGFNLTNVSEKYADGEKPSGDDKSSFKPGFQIGVVGEYALSDAFAIQPGIVFATQGATYKWGEKAKTVIALNYLQVPINAQYKLDLGGAKLLLQAGPYLGFALSGKYKNWDDEGKKVEPEDDELAKIKIGSNKDEDDMKAFDFGLGLGAGVQFGNIQAGVGYNLGLVNTAFREEGDTKSFSKNNGLAITLTYLFGE